jgi:hypothetical protein
MKTTNKEKIQAVVKEHDLKIGCWDKKIELLTQKELKKVLENAPYEADTDVFIKKKLHVVEIDIVDGEVDFSVLTQAEYINRYGDERWDNEA